MLNPGEVFNKTWETFQKDVGTLLLTGVVVSVLTAVTIGILGGPLLAGYLQMLMKRMRLGSPVQFGDVFAEMENLGRYLPPFYVIVILTIIGIPLLFVPAVLVVTFFMLVFPLMLDRPELSFGEAVNRSIAMVKATGFPHHLAVGASVVALHVVLLAIAMVMGGPLFVVVVTGLGLAYTGVLVVTCYLSDIADADLEVREESVE